MYVYYHGAYQISRPLQPAPRILGGTVRVWCGYHAAGKLPEACEAHVGLLVLLAGLEASF